MAVEEQADRGMRTVTPPVSDILDERLLGLTLTFVAGAANAGGFLLVGMYTSHMSGVVAAIADNVIVGSAAAVLVGVSALVSFVAGAACSAIQINWGRRHLRTSPYVMPFLTEAALLLIFGILGGIAQWPGATLVAIPLLCFLMGLQNATITKISGARIRTTHVTGIVTDIGIEFGKLIYWNRAGAALPVVADRAKLVLLAGMLACFVAGGVVGAISFSQLGFSSCLPLAAILTLSAWRVRNGLRA